MKSCKNESKSVVMWLMWSKRTKLFPLFWSKTTLMEVLTMRKHAPIITAFILTSRSMGNCIPKLSTFVNASWRSPVHCLLIFPILLDSSIVRICGGEGSQNGSASRRVTLTPAEPFPNQSNVTQPTSKSTSGTQVHPQNGPLIFSTGSVCSLATMNFGENGCHCCLT